MPPSRTVTLSDELYDQASREAAAEGKTTDEIAQEALAAYLALRRLDRLQEYGQRRADETRVTEADVPRLIADARRESRQ
jgi:predicted transcriptional regulator